MLNFTSYIQRKYPHNWVFFSLIPHPFFVPVKIGPFLDSSNNIFRGNIEIANRVGLYKIRDYPIIYQSTFLKASNLLGPTFKSAS